MLNRTWKKICERQSQGGEDWRYQRDNWSEDIGTAGQRKKRKSTLMKAGLYIKEYLVPSAYSYLLIHITTFEDTSTLSHLCIHAPPF